MTSHAVALNYGTWVPYFGSARTELAVVLVIVAAVVGLLGTVLRLPARLPRPGQPLTIVMVTIWFLAIIAFLVCFSVYVAQYRRMHLPSSPVHDPITPVTFLAAFVTFAIIFVTGPPEFGPRLVSGVVGAIAGPMIFELPFDLIVMSRTYPAIPPDPALYRVIFFAPLFLIEITSLAMLTLSPVVEVTRAAFFSFALMLIVFAVWALSGFHYPNAALPITWNVVSKLLAFVAVLSLFLPRKIRERRAAKEPGASPAQPAPPEPQPSTG
jgi:hypothetical protein